MHRYPDAYLNHWSDVYVARRLRRRGITLEQFLARPEQILAGLDRKPTGRTLLSEPVQNRRERRALAALRMRGEILIQKLWRGSRRGSRSDVPLEARK